MKIFLPVNPAELVARGACLTRVQGDCRLASGSRISVGIMTFIKWKDVKKKCPDAHHFVVGGDRYTLWCRVITWVIKKVNCPKMRVRFNVADRFRVIRPILKRQSSTMMDYSQEDGTSNRKTASYSMRPSSHLRLTQVKLGTLCLCTALMILGERISKTLRKSMGVILNQPNVLPEVTDL